MLRLSAATYRIVCTSPYRIYRKFTQSAHLRRRLAFLGGILVPLALENQTKGARSTSGF